MYAIAIIGFLPYAHVWIDAFLLLADIKGDSVRCHSRSCQINCFLNINDSRRLRPPPPYVGVVGSIIYRSIGPGNQWRCSLSYLRAADEFEIETGIECEPLAFVCSLFVFVLFFLSIDGCSYH